MSNGVKGLVVALVLVAVVGAQLASIDAMEHGYIIYLGILAIPCGIYAGSFAGTIREDRFLRIAAFGLAVPGFLGFIVLMIHYSALTEVAMKLVSVSAIPISIAAAALERWTRPADLLPPANGGHGRRKPTTIELAVILTVITSAVIAVMIVASDQPSPHDFSWSYKRGSAIDHDRVHEVFVFLAGMALPIGVLLGRLAQTLLGGRLFTLGVIALLGAMWIGCLFEVFTHVGFRGHYLLPIIPMIVVLERMTRPQLDRPRTPLGTGALGMLIGGANGIAISLALLLLVLRHASAWSMEVLLIPCVILVFALPAGAIVGGIAGRIKHGRGVILQLIAFVGVALLAMAFELPIRREPSALGFFVWSCMTTAIGVWILERATRPR